VGLTITGMPSIGDGLIAGNDDGAHHRVGRRLSPSVLREGERSPHPLLIERSRHADMPTS
jgi:hypothetical protein